MLDMSVDWILKLNSQQLNTVLRALRGVLKPEQLEDARKLADTIASARVQITKNKINEITKLEENLNAVNRH